MRVWYGWSMLGGQCNAIEILRRGILMYANMMEENEVFIASGFLLASVLLKLLFFCPSSASPIDDHHYVEIAHNNQKYLHPWDYFLTRTMPYPTHLHSRQITPRDSNYFSIRMKLNCSVWFRRQIVTRVLGI